MVPFILGGFMKTEMCIESFEGAKIAANLGFTSVEVNTGLYLGGLTPSMALVRNISKNLDIQSMVMIRNRAGGFCYTEEEYEEMKLELELFLKEDITGVVFGFLKEDYTIDIDRTRYFVEEAHKAGKLAIVHRAFDNTKDPIEAIECLISLGVDRILTSGQGSTAFEGRELLKELISTYSDRIEILAGAGLNSSNIEEFIEYTGATLVHSSCKGYKKDITTTNKVSYSYLGNNNYQVVDKEEAKAFRKMVD